MSSMLPKTSVILEGCAVMSGNHYRKNMCEAYSCLQEQRMLEIMGDLRLNRSLDLKEVRKEQRRVAALLGHETRVLPNHTLYKSPRGGQSFHQCLCSKLPGKSQCIHASHNFLQEGLANMREDRARARRERNESKVLKRRYSVDSAELHRKHVRGIKGRTLTPLNRSPTVVKGALQYKDSVMGKDIHDFSYKQLAEDLIGRELGESPGGLLNAQQNNLHHVPKNTPESSMILMKMRNRKKLEQIDKQGGGGLKSKHKQNGGNKKQQVVLSQTVNKGKGGDILRYTHSRIGDTSAMDYCTCGESRHGPVDTTQSDGGLLTDGAASVASYTSGYYTDSPKSGDHTKLRSPRKGGGSMGKEGPSGPSIYGNQSPGQKYRTPFQQQQQQGGRWCANCGKCKIPRTEMLGSKDDKHSRGLHTQGYRSSGLPGGGYALSREHSMAMSVNSISSGSFIRLNEEYGDRWDDLRYQRSPDYDIPEGHAGRMSPLSDYESANPTSGLGENGESDADQSGGQTMGFYTQGLNGGRKRDLYPDGYQEAYDKALAAVQFQKLPLEPWMLGSRISKPYQFSYFEPNPYPTECEGCSEPIKKPAKAEYLRKKVKPMRHVFGQLDVNDFYPGGKRNPLALRK